MKISGAWAVMSALGAFNSVLWAILFTANGYPIHWASWVLMTAACYACRRATAAYRRDM